MRTHTNEFKQEIKKLGRQINGKIYVYSNYDLSSENNNNILTEDDIQIISEKFNKQEATEIDSNLIYSMNIIKNGNLLKSLMKEFDFEAKYDLNIGTAVNPHFGLLVNNSYEYLDYGDYIIYSKEYNLDSETWNYVCYDMMLYSMIKYTPIKDITYPTTIRNYISVIADKMGVEFANKEDEFVNYDQLVNEELFKDKGYTLRDILDKLSEVTASNIIINDNNELEIKYPKKNITEEKTVEGTNISISDNVGDTISDLQLQGNTYQQTYTGKNLFNKFKSTSSTNGASLTQINNGIKATVTVAGANKYIALKLDNPDNLLGKTLTISGNIAKSGSNDALIRFYFTNGNTLVSNIANTIYQTGKSTFTVPASYPTNCNGISIVFSATASNSGSVGNYVDYTNVQLEVGSTQTSYEPYVGGTASPNPDYPQAIQNVTGRQTIDVVGKNLLNTNYMTEFTPAQLTWYSVDGVDSFYNETQIKKSNVYYDLKANTTYTLSVYSVSNKSTSASNPIQLVNLTGTVIANISQSETNVTFTPSSNVKVYPRMLVQSANTSTQCVLQLEQGSTATTYEEYKGQSYEVNLGKNLFDKQEIIDNETYLSKANVDELVANDSGISWKSTGNDSYISLPATITGGYGMYIEVNENTQYTLSFNSNYELTNYIHYIKGDYTFISRNNSLGHNSNVSFTTPLNCKYIFIRFGAANQSGNTINITNIQLETGSQATTYSEYFTPIELNKIGNYQDRIYKQNGTWYIEKKIGKVVLDGTENWQDTGTNRFNVVGVITDYLKSVNTKTYLSNYYIPFNQTNANSDFNNLTSNSNYGFNMNSSTGTDLRIKHTGIDNVSDFKTWLGNNKPQINYVLSTPTYTEITNTDLINQLESIELLNGINNIMVSSGDLAGALKIKYFSKYETINEEYLKDINVAFGEQFGPINRVSIADSEDNYEYYAEDMTSISKNKKTQINIIDNEFVFNDDTQTICQAIFNKLNGLNYSLNDFATTGVCYYDFLDIYNVQAKGNTYQCLLLNNEISINQGIEENIFTEEPENNEKSSNNYETSILSNKAVTFKINQQEKRLEQAVMEDNVIASLNLAIEDGQGIIEIKGNQVTIESDNFILNEDGEIEAKAGVIGGFTMNDKTFSSNIYNKQDIWNGQEIVQEEVEIFTNDDLNKVRNYITGQGTLTPEELTKYDVNHDGIVDVSDLAIMTVSTYYNINDANPGKFLLNTESAIDTLVLYDKDNNERVSLGIYDFIMKNTDGSKKTQINFNGVSSPAFNNNSLESMKKNIEPLKNALNLINNSNIYSYNWKNEKDTDDKHYGLIIGKDYETPQEFLSQDKMGIDLYAMSSICLQAIKEQQMIINNLQKEIKILRRGDE